MLLPAHRFRFATLLAAAGATHLTLGFAAALPVWLVGALVLFALRSPSREIPSPPYGLICPADGIVTGAGEGHDPYLDRAAHAVRIRVARSGPFVIRSPIEGRVTEIWVRPRERRGSGGHAICIVGDAGDEVVMALTERLPVWRLLNTIGVGERIGQGQVYGFLPFGGVVEVFAPSRTRLAVGAGQAVRAGSDQLGRMLHD